MSLMKIGELARRAGVTVRSLRFYDEIGLLSPALHSEGGHRLYGEREVRRLQRIRSLQSMNFSLKQIRDCLKHPQFSAAGVIRLQLDELERQFEALSRLRNRLLSLEDRLSRSQDISIQEFLQVMEDMTMIEKYYTPEQREFLRQRAQEVGSERIRQVENEWKELFRRLDAARKQGTEPGSPAVREMGRQALGLIAEFSGGNSGIENSLEKMYREEGTAPINRQPGFNVSPELWSYLSQAMAAAREEE